MKAITNKQRLQLIRDCFKYGDGYFRWWWDKSPKEVKEKKRRSE